MRDGRLVGTFQRDEITSRSQLIQLIIGRSERELVRARHHTATGEVALSARGLCWRGKVRDVDLDVRVGEVTGLAGLVGSGRSELVSMLFGALRPDAGEVTVKGRRITRFSPAQGIRAGVALLPEDRRGQAAFTSLTLRENITISALRRFSFGPFISRVRERRTCRALAERLGIVARGPESRLGQLSGGNQQKVIIAKWLQTEADVLLFDEPTQGVDVGAQEEIHRLMRDLAHEGKAVVFISSDLEETLRVTDRTVVLRRGRVVGDLSGDDATIEEVLALCFGTDEIPIGTAL
jgi:ABC-type sugar transport system ATPase subunit